MVDKNKLGFKAFTMMMALLLCAFVIVGCASASGNGNASGEGEIEFFQGAADGSNNSVTTNSNHGVQGGAVASSSQVDSNQVISGQMEGFVQPDLPQIDPPGPADLPQIDSSSQADSTQHESAQSPGVVASNPSTSVSTASRTPKSSQGAAKQSEAADTESPESLTVHVSITGEEDTGTILPMTEMVIEEGDTVVDVLKRLTKANDIQLETRGRGGRAYVEGIANLYEFDKGPTSGWVVGVNGTLISQSSGAYEVETGDQIEWYYSLNLGKDFPDSSS